MSETWTYSRNLAADIADEDAWYFWQGEHFLGSVCSEELAKEIISDHAAVSRMREALERIGWHELTWQEARDAARAALNPDQED